MKKHILRLILILWACSFYSCTEDPELISSFDDISQPDLNIIDVLPNTSTITVSTIKFTWEAANAYAIDFSYKLLMGGAIIQDWSEWTEIDSTETDMSITFEHLDEGSYQFQVKSRYFETEQDTPDSYSFIVDAISGPALRFYPLHKEVGGTEGTAFTMDVYAEEVTNLVGAEFQFTYDPNMVSFISTGPGSFLSTSPGHILIEEHNATTSTVTLTLTTTEDEGVGLTGTGSLVQISFQRTSSGTVGLNFINDESAVWVQSSAPNSSISFSTLVNGSVDLP